MVGLSCLLHVSDNIIISYKQVTEQISTMDQINTPVFGAWILHLIIGKINPQNKVMTFISFLQLAATNAFSL